MADKSNDKKPAAKNEAAQHLKEALARIQAAKKEKNGEGKLMAKSDKGHGQVGAAGRIFRTQGRGGGGGGGGGG